MTDGTQPSLRPELAVPLFTEQVDATDASLRVRQAFLAAKRSELLGPLQAIIDFSEILLGDAVEIDRADFLEDLHRIHAAGKDLLHMVVELFSAERLAEGADLPDVQSRMKHDFRGKLNAVINYPEMWLEDGEPFLEAFIPDLERIHSAGKKCLVLVDSILSTDLNSLEGDDARAVASQTLLAQVQKLMDVHQHFDTRPAEVGRLLIVDDSEVNCDILRRRLESQGHSVEVAHTGQEGLDLLAREPFDLVLLDIILPGMNGVEVLVEIKQNVKLRDIPVIMISALDEVDVVVRCIKLGAEDYLSKPFDPVFLKARIGACLEKRRMREREVSYLQQIEQEKLRSDELLHVILPSKIVSELKLTNRVLPRNHEQVGVLFADIVNFTQFCEHHTAEEVVEHLQSLVEQWEDIALRHHVSKIKTIGDAFMAASGLLTDVESPVLNCINAGLEMIAATQDLSVGWNLRVGIHCGKVVAGVLGRRQYLFDLWGDTVNTAARMESHGVPGCITLSASAFDRVRNVCRGRSLGMLPVKGKGDMEMICFDGFVV